MRALSTTTRLLRDADPLSVLFEEVENCDTSVHSQGSSTSAKLEESDASRTVQSSPPPSSDARVRLEEAKQKRLKRQLKDVGDELNALLNEKGRVAAQVANKAYVPARAAKTFLSSAELIQEKAPQEFVADEQSAEELVKVPLLQHSGCSAVITMVGVVAKAPQQVSVTFPGGYAESGCVEFTVRYEIPFVQASTSMLVTVRAVGATLSTFVQENVSVGDVVHVLGHLAPFNTPGKDGSLCAIYVLPAGGNVTVVLSKAAT
ncbi:hypothetical protein ABB37_02785 [Leptomonas pyrrhocoris]|uniref:Uncharacterized protein n=1 Tax=Leptomonas pyrrhocoris TaxID=157538 RepID=A0A0M9G676_LEPPY|nr:hypothetical protein ABB37_02785 [Leptomonas pyrrhocoris]KPA83069.1 hypothetical protein ABB37_02785 [Leptomonas pyrrhocoris]|eukprot:XP_015661508.1 hypothetical protein ABB37_02785 [Leptomonas pyrrhocoris]